MLYFDTPLHQEWEMGFKANLVHLCGCHVILAGRTMQDLLQNFNIHMADVHKDSEDVKELREKLHLVAEKI